MRCKKCGVKRNALAFNEDGMYKECARASKNCGLGSFVK
jgi:hypothetical protein